MRHKSELSLMLLTIIIFSFPSICFSESKTIEGENCQIYLGDMKNKKELEKIRKSVRRESIKDGLSIITDISDLTHGCVSHVISNYLEKVRVVSHTEEGRKICEKVKITLDPGVIEKYLTQDICRVYKIWEFLGGWNRDINHVLKDKGDKINIGLILETKIPDIDEHKKELLENEEERQFHVMIEGNKDKYKVVDRRHLTKILEEQKLSSSGITDSETIKLGKILNLDIIVLRILYDKSQVTKVLKVETGEVLLFKTYETKTEEGWIFHGESNSGDKYYYDKKSITIVRPNVVKVWEKWKLPRTSKNRFIQMRKENNEPIDGWDKLDYLMTLQEVDCKNYIIKRLKFVFYDNKGELLDSWDEENPIIERIPPESIMESLRREVCKE